MRRMRNHPIRALLSIVGISAGVAMIFAVQVSNRSVVGSFDELKRSIVGRATLELVSINPIGVGQSVYARVKKIPEVEAAAPVLEQRVIIRGRKVSKSIPLYGADERLRRLDGKLIRAIGTRYERDPLGVYLPEATADEIGAWPGQTIGIGGGGRTTHTVVSGVLSESQVGSLMEGNFAVASLGLAQELAGTGSRINRVFVAVRAGASSSSVRRKLKRVAGAGMDIRPVDQEAKILRSAAKADRDSSTLFGEISLVVGLLLVFNSMLMTTMERRRDFAMMRMLGAESRILVGTLLVEAIVLGLVGSALGLVLGDQLSRHLFQDAPQFLTSVFAIGSQRTVPPEVVVLSFATGVVAAVAAAAYPSFLLLRVPAAAALSEERLGTREGDPAKAPWKILLLSLLLMGGSIIALVLSPADLGVISVAAFAAGSVLLLPHLVPRVISAAQRVADRHSSSILSLSLAELAASPVRTTALAGIGALAAFSVVTIGGATGNLQRGIAQSVGDFTSRSDLLVSERGSDNFLPVRRFNEEVVERLSRSPGVKDVRQFRAAFLDWGNKRVWAIGESRRKDRMIPRSQIVAGNPQLANERLRRGGWAAVTVTIAKERGLEIGHLFLLPTPSGQKSYRLAATVTSYGWPGGVVVLNGEDFKRDWRMSELTGAAVDLKSGVTAGDGKRVLTEKLSKTSLQIRTPQEQKNLVMAVLKESLTRLNKITNMVLIAALMAVVAVVLTALWQRRRRLAMLNAIGMGPSKAYQALILETGAVLILGALIGICLALPLQALAGRWISETTGHPVQFAIEWGILLKVLGASVLFTVLAALIPARLAGRLVIGRDLSPE